jgi:hypothetical protein
MRLFVLVVIALLALGALAATRGVNLTLTVAEGQLVVEPRGLDVLWTLRRRIEIPLDRITEVRVAPRTEAPAPALRLKGAHVPGMIIAGTYRNGEHRTFWDVRRADRVLLIGCDGKAPYHLLVLEFAEPYTVLARVRGALGD